MKIKEYENKECSYWGIDLSRKPEDRGFEADIETMAIKGFEYTTVNGHTVINALRVWERARTRWRAQAWGEGWEADTFAEHLRDAWLKSMIMDHKHGLIK